MNGIVARRDALSDGSARRFTFWRTVTVQGDVVGVGDSVGMPRVGLTISGAGVGVKVNVGSGDGVNVSVGIAVRVAVTADVRLAAKVRVIVGVGS